MTKKLAKMLKNKKFNKNPFRLFFLNQMKIVISKSETSLKLQKISVLENKRKMKTKNPESDQMKNLGIFCYIFRAIKESQKMVDENRINKMLRNV